MIHDNKKELPQKNSTYKPEIVRIEKENNEVEEMKKCKEQVREKEREEFDLKLVIEVF